MNAEKAYNQQPPIEQQQIAVQNQPTEAYPPMYQQHPVAMGQPVVNYVPVYMGFSNNPQLVVCPFCHVQSVTRTRREVGAGTWLLCLGICFFSCCGPIVFMINECKDLIHTCSNCGRDVGIKKFIDI